MNVLTVLWPVVMAVCLCYCAGGDIDISQTSEECRCCSLYDDEGCCTSCAENSSNERYNRERRSGYRTRFVSSCSCCFTRRLTWCCEICTNYAKRGYTMRKRESPASAMIYVSADSDIPEKSGEVRNAKVYSNIGDDLRVSSTDSTTSHVYDCMCCLIYKYDQCCIKCKN